MRTIDNDIKTLNDDLNEVRNNLNQYVKKEGSSYLQKDISEDIYGDTNLKPEHYFVEVHNSQFLCSLIVILHK
jgi:Zn-dependent M32 family carboxypeptidase